MVDPLLCCARRQLLPSGWLFTSGVFQISSAEARVLQPALQRRLSKDGRSEADQLLPRSGRS